MQPAIFIMGPTAAGKTDLAFKLFDALPCEIISVDSALIYKGMDIGTAKSDAALLKKYPHRLIDILEPTEAYSAARFRAETLAAMAEITAAGRIPLLVGGTMLYFRALQYGLAELPAANPEVRARLDAEMEEKGLEVLHQRLQQVDPQSAARIHRNDPQRIQRALEVFEVSGMTMSELHAQGKAGDFPYSVAKIVVAPSDRKVLHARIERRFLQMLEQGFVDEVVALKGRDDLDVSMPSMRAVGYRQVWESLDGTYGYDEMLKRGVVATRQFAKRQLTWLRADKEAVWFESESPDLLGNTLKFLKSALKLEP